MLILGQEYLVNFCGAFSNQWGLTDQVDLCSRKFLVTSRGNSISVFSLDRALCRRPVIHLLCQELPFESSINTLE